MFSIFDVIPKSLLIRIVDLGAMRCDGSGAVYDRLVDSQACEIFGFEAQEDECANLEDYYRARVPFRAYPVVVGDGNWITFHRLRRRSTSSTFAPKLDLCSEFLSFAENLEVESSFKVKSVCLDDYAELVDIDYVKSDLQGGDLNAMAGAHRVLADVMVMEVEAEFLEQYEQQPLFSDIDSRLRNLGFFFHTFVSYGTRPLKPLLSECTTGDRGLSQWIWANAVYLRPFYTWGKWAPQKVLKMAVVLHEVYCSYDFAYRALVVYDKSESTNWAEAYREAFSAQP